MMKKFVTKNQINVVDIIMIRNDARVVRMELKKDAFTTIKILVKELLEHVQN
jgi:hypothetical protein